VDRGLLIREQRGLYVKLARSQGAGGSRPSDRTWVFQIRSGVDRNGTRRPPHDQISTLQIQNASYTCHPSDLNRTAHNRQTRIGIQVLIAAVGLAIDDKRSFSYPQPTNRPNRAPAAASPTGARRTSPSRPPRRIRGVILAVEDLRGGTLVRVVGLVSPASVA
jgi:hypothetical protein